MRKLGYLFLLFVMVSCESAQKEIIDPKRLPNMLFYPKGSLYACNGETTVSATPSVQGDSPMQFGLSVEPLNDKISINAQDGKITVAPDSPLGIFKISVKASNALGSREFKDVLTVYVNVLNSKGISFSKDVRPLVQLRCANCHTNGSGRDWTIYENAKNKILDIISQTESGSMPLNAPPLSPAEVQIFRDWLMNCFLE